MEKKKRSKLIYLFGLLPVVFSLCTFLALLYTNLLYFYIGKTFANIIIFGMPVLSVACAAILTVIFVKKKDVICPIFVAVILVCAVLSFLLTNNASESKIQGDFLKHENAFNSTAKLLINDYNIDNGNLRTFSSDELKYAVPSLKAEVIPTESKTPTVFFYTLEADDRIEGYAYIPDSFYPIAWDVNYTEWSDALDIEKQWYYICIYK